MIQWIEKRKCGEIVWSASQEGLLSLNWHFPCHISNFGSPLAWIYLKWGFLGMWNMGPMPLWWEKTAKTTQKYMWFYRALLGVLGVLSLLCTHAMGLRDWQNEGAFIRIGPTCDNPKFYFISLFLFYAFGGYFMIFVIYDKPNFST